jgi:hypothetical protein
MAFPHCTGPGCDLPAARCDADHNVPYSAGGETALFNTTPMCTPHNNLKQQDGWSVSFDMETGVVTWVSADGTRTIDLPPPDV